MNELKQKAYVPFIIFFFILGFHCFSLFLDFYMQTWKCKKRWYKCDAYNMKSLNVPTYTNGLNTL